MNLDNQKYQKLINKLSLFKNSFILLAERLVLNYFTKIVCRQYVDTWIFLGEAMIIFILNLHYFDVVHSFVSY